MECRLNNNLGILGHKKYISCGSALLLSKKSSGERINRFESLGCFIDNTQVKVSIRISQKTYDNLILKFYSKERMAFVEFKAKLKMGFKRNDGLIYKINEAGESGVYWLSITKVLNPIQICKAELMEQGRYDPSKIGAPYNNDNFIHEFAIKGKTDFIWGKSILLVEAAMNELLSTNICLDYEKHLTFKHLEINTGIYSSNPEQDFEKLKLFTGYLFGEPVRGGNLDQTYIDYQICKAESKSNPKSKNIKFYKKVRPSADGKVLGMIRAEITLANVPFKTADDMNQVANKTRDELLTITTWLFECLNPKPSISSKVVKAFLPYPELKSRAVIQELIPTELKDYFMVIKCAGLNPANILKPKYSNLIYEV